MVRSTDSEMIKVETRKCGHVDTLSALWDRSGLEFSRGYLPGIFDAEGSFGTSKGSKPGSLRISNTNKAYLDAIIAHGTAAGFKFKIENFHETVLQDRSTVRLAGRDRQVLRRGPPRPHLQETSRRSAPE